MTAITETLAQTIGVKAACAVLTVPRSRVYRARRPPPDASPRSRPVQALSEDERTQVREMLNSQRFADRAPRQVYAVLRVHFNLVGS